jgi:putative membrane protein
VQRQGSTTADPSSGRADAGRVAFRLMPLVGRLAVAWAINVLALWIASGLFGGVQIHGWEGYLIGSAVLGIANTILKPVLAVLTLPLIIVTLGLFLLVINIAIVALAAWIAPNFSVHGFWTYVGVVVIVWLVNWAGHAFVERAMRGAWT